MATFGFELKGDTGYFGFVSGKRTNYHCPEAGRLDTISAYFFNNTGGNVTADVGIFNVNALLAHHNVVVANAFDDWKVIDFSADVIDLLHQDYGLALKPKTAGSFYAYYTTDAVFVSGSDTLPAASDLVDPWTEDGAGTRKWSLHADYTPTVVGGQPYRKRVQGIAGMRTW